MLKINNNSILVIILKKIEVVIGKAIKIIIYTKMKVMMRLMMMTIIIIPNGNSYNYNSDGNVGERCLEYWSHPGEESPSYR